MEKWYKKSFWRNLVDMHIPDDDERYLSEFSAEEYARLVEISGADTAILYTSNCLGKTFFGKGNVHGALKGRDFVAERIEAFKKRGIRVVLYFNIWNRTSAILHPDWEIKAIGQISEGMNGRFRRCCINSEGFRAYVREMLTHIAESYDFEGVWLDMVDWFSTICACESCKKKFKEEYGFEIPTRVDFRNKEFCTFREARERWLREFILMCKSTVEGIKPDATFTFQNAAWKRGWDTGCTEESMQMSEFLAGDFYASPLSYSVTCKLLNNATKNKPIEFMTSVCADLSEHTTSKTRSELLRTVWGATAHNAAFVSIDAIDPSGRMNESRYKRLREIKEMTDPCRAEITPDAKIISDVTYYINHESLFEDVVMDIPSYNLENALYSRITTFAATMIEKHIAYDLNLKRNLDKIDSPVIYIPGLRIITESEAESLRRYVMNGGTLIASGDVGILNKDGAQNADFAISDLLGVHRIKSTDEDIVYFTANERGLPYFGEYDEGYPVAVNSSGTLVRADDDALVLATLSLPISRSDDVDKFSSAISNPPFIHTDYPAITERRVGLGKVIYIAAPLERGKQDMQKRLLASLITQNEKRRVSVECASWLECISYYDEMKDRFIINFYNTMENYYEAVDRNVKYTLKTDKKITKVYNVMQNCEIPFEYAEGYLTVCVGDVDGFSMIIAE